MHALAKGSRGLTVLALALAVTNLVLWYAAPWIRDVFDAWTGRLALPHRPVIVNGGQELLVYYDPWLARGVFPVVYTLGFVAIALLFSPTPSAAGAGSGSAAMAILLLGFEAVWVFLFAFTIFFRGSNWNLIWPWDASDPKIEPLTWLSFSDIFYRSLAALRVEDSPWVVREAPGLLLAVGCVSLGLLTARALSRGAGYSTAYWGCILLMLFVLTPLSLRKLGVEGLGGLGPSLLVILPVASLILAASYLLLRLLRARRRSPVVARPMACWRCVLLVFLVGLAALVPVKILLYWAFGLKYFLHVPEYSWNV